MSWKSELRAEPAKTREEIDDYMNGYPNRDEFDYEVVADTVGKRPIIPIWHITVVKRGDDLKDVRKWCHAWRAHRAVQKDSA